MGNKKIICGVALVVFVCGFLFICTDSAMAVGVLDGVKDKFQIAAKSWEKTLRDIALQTFYFLFFAQFVWNVAQLAMRGGGSFSDWIQFLLMEIMYCGVWLWIIDDGGAFVIGFVEGFTDIGGELVALSQSTSGDFANVATVTPSTVIDLGIEMFKAGVAAAGSAGGWIDMLYSVVVALVMMPLVAIYALIAGSLLVAHIEAYFIAYGGIVLLGFAGTSFSRDYAFGYLRTGIGTGVKIMTIIGLVSIMIKFGQDWKTSLEGMTDLKLLLPLLGEIMGCSIVFFMLSWQVPSLAQAMISGGGGSGNVGNLISAAKGVGSMATAPAKIAASAAGGAMLGGAGGFFTGAYQGAKGAIQDIAKRVSADGGSSAGNSFSPGSPGGAPPPAPPSPKLPVSGNSGMQTASSGGGSADTAGTPPSEGVASRMSSERSVPSTPSSNGGGESSGGGPTGGLVKNVGSVVLATALGGIRGAATGSFNGYARRSPLIQQIRAARELAKAAREVPENNPPFDPDEATPPDAPKEDEGGKSA